VHTVAVGEAERQRVGEAEREGLPVLQALALPVGQWEGEGVAEGVRQLVEEGEGVKASTPLGVTLALGVRVLPVLAVAAAALAVAPPTKMLGVPVEVPEEVAHEEKLLPAPREGVAPARGEAVELAVAQLLREAVKDPELVAPAEALPASLAVALGVPLRHCVMVLL
jgi:hypothetical protein